MAEEKSTFVFWIENFHRSPLLGIVNRRLSLTIDPPLGARPLSFFNQYLLLIFVAVLPFEIRDSLSDTTALGTVPQLIGITRYLGVFILILLLTSKLYVNHFSLHTIVFMAMLTAYVFFFLESSKEIQKILPYFGLKQYRP